jgi:putative Mn2+ efflux pump MntP
MHNMDWIGFVIGWVLILIGFIAIVEKLTRRDFEMSISAGHMLSLWIMSIIFGIVMIIKAI